jgi:hypothetical protein
LTEVIFELPADQILPFVEAAAPLLLDVVHADLNFPNRYQRWRICSVMNELALEMLHDRLCCLSREHMSKRKDKKRSLALLP